MSKTCYRCGQQGHLERNCRQSSTLSSSSVAPDEQPKHAPIYTAKPVDFKLPRLELSDMEDPRIVVAKYSKLAVISTFEVQTQTKALIDAKAVPQVINMLVSVRMALALQRLIAQYYIVDEAFSDLRRLYGRFELCGDQYHSHVTKAKQVNQGYRTIGGSGLTDIGQEPNWNYYWSTDNSLRWKIAEIQNGKDGSLIRLCQDFDCFCRAFGGMVPCNEQIVRWVIFIQTFCGEISKKMRAILAKLNGRFEAFLRHRAASLTICRIVEGVTADWDSQLQRGWTEPTSEYRKEIVGRVQEHRAMLDSKMAFTNTAVKVKYLGEPHWSGNQLKFPPAPPAEQWASDFPMYNRQRYCSSMVSKPCSRSILHWSVPCIKTGFVAAMSAVTATFAAPAEIQNDQQDMQQDLRAKTSIRNQISTSFTNSKKRTCDVGNVVAEGHAPKRTKPAGSKESSNLPFD